MKRQECLIFASGGIKNGVDIAKSIALGASLCGLAGPFVRSAVQSPDELEKTIEYLVKGLRIAMFGAGYKNSGRTTKRKPLRDGTDY